ncbi:Sphingoid base hydroxylase 1 [Morus notabilis]|uniref:Sphingoid base hydroxylase 1 n=1 Tax=Morus notabilis TaxID=981085 RepID=W9QV87_9ROSA|nr:Sphingoid base hydroxylase 1 [Morus notabilis]
MNYWQFLFRSCYIGYVLVTGSNSGDVASPKPSLMVLARQFVTAMLVFDTWQYFMHRYFHQNEFLYKHFHSQHHRLIVPYAFGAIYHHPFEGLISDVIGSALTVPLSDMSPRASIFFFSFATIKNVDDHCGLWLPRGSPFHIFFRNNQLYGSKYNFATPFFVHWDRILGTHMPYSLDERAGGGFEARTADDNKND